MRGASEEITVKESKIPSNYVLEFTFFDDKENKTVEAWHNPTEKDIKKAWIRKEK